MGRQAINTMSEGDLRNFGRNVRVRMAALDTTSTELAELVGMTKQAVNVKIRRGGPDAVAFFATILGVDEGELLADSPAAVGAREPISKRKIAANAKKVSS